MPLQCQTKLKCTKVLLQLFSFVAFQVTFGAYRFKQQFKFVYKNGY